MAFSIFFCEENEGKRPIVWTLQAEINRFVRLF